MSSSFEFGSSIEVQLDVFSGLPNPRWTVAGDHVRELERYLTDISQAPARSAQSRLGYCGFRLSGKDVLVRVFDSTITITNEGRASAFADERGLEEHLREQARQRGYATLVDSRL